MILQGGYDVFIQITSPHPDIRRNRSPEKGVIAAVQPQLPLDFRAVGRPELGVLPRIAWQVDGRTLEGGKAFAFVKRAAAQDRARKGPRNGVHPLGVCF